MDNNILSQTNDSGITTITLNRAEKHNAFDDAMLAELKKKLLEAEQDPNSRLVLLNAKGKSFSAGADLGWMQRMVNFNREENLRDAHILATTLKTLNNLNKPTIACIQGNAYGGALGLICCCDMAITDENALFSFSEVKLGLIPATISPYVIQSIGPRAARRYFLTAEIFNAQTAYHIGLIHERTPSHLLMPKVNTLCESILANCPSAIVRCKQLIINIQGQDIDEQLIDQTCQEIADIRASDSAQEKLKQFLNSRKT